jgi:hypothetical protein
MKLGYELYVCIMYVKEKKRKKFPLLIAMLLHISMHQSVLRLQNYVCADASVTNEQVSRIDSSLD